MTSNDNVKPSPVWGHMGDQVVRRNLKGVTLVQRKQRNTVVMPRSRLGTKTADCAAITPLK